MQKLRHQENARLVSKKTDLYVKFNNKCHIVFYKKSFYKRYIISCPPGEKENKLFPRCNVWPEFFHSALRQTVEVGSITSTNYWDTSSDISGFFNIHAQSVFL